MSKSGYVDTCLVSVERLRKARKNINIGCIVSAGVTSFFFVIGMVYFLFTSSIIFIPLFFIAMMDGILLVGLVVKREIFSMMIYLKEVTE